MVATYLFLIAQVCSLVVWVVISLRRSPYTPFQSGLYFVNALFTRILWRTRICGKLNLAPGQGAVLVSNHTSSIDPCFLQLFTGRVVHWMVAREFIEQPLYGSFLRATQVIGTRRGGVDTAAIRTAIRYAQQGRLVGILPEGRINMSTQFMMPVRPGAALIALRARVPIVPCYIQGAPYDRTPYSPLLMSAKVRLLIGEPIDLSEFYDREGEHRLHDQIMLRVVQEIACLAGQQNFQPQLASRHWKPSPAELQDAMVQSAKRRRSG